MHNATLACKAGHLMHISLNSITDSSYAEAELRLRNRYDCSDTPEQGSQHTRCAIQLLQQEETRVLYSTELLLLIDKDILLTGLSVKPSQDTQKHQPI